MSSPESALPPALLLLGPTASGKTASALALAATLPVEIISVDSALVYRDMDIGTAKPSAAEQAVCPHHLIDVVSPEEAYSAARFCAEASVLMRDISARGRIPLLAGGTMLYFKALRDGLSDLPPADPVLRRAIEERAAAAGWPALHAELARLDPDAAARLEPTDAQRIQRALEIVTLSGAPLAASYARREDAPLPCRLLPIALAPSDRAVLHARIEQRFDQMLAAGLVDEVAALRERYVLQPQMASMRCVGYRQAWEFLDGEIDRATLRFKGIAATRQLAKRQLTWQRQFRDQWPELVELDCLAPDLPQHVRDTALRLLGA
ncbi:tRNA (adenosine(37)-N6)-dimethylallyltransferase MiaA [Azoarcus olearius]|uniref:tRNA dimethylallyltransferase n=1 Tax=Azoarcus sp. (strain BH72) TaxID=418699 RepID=MIAA_AZOSB|nr:tRNA (adenosine(37)-N6)-dimethylallyltransferase MiaA [Azoarcus olearius]A1KA92.1 RecName: Full=tRNA dimethylallyltransferase; AltName: Full=Dimethylallyl diphosphate:tRNA dimethylallyltransferase; Short=DMAPP:tRNA dimethylallyltransferase; Short=DMATase; AltName: Full=Isopentenyl-diphosphate:tRNA isopentenyltransferase; Short=IPP transferase; Short=IPPT; Short=IPTase [Azoarcus olearius]CAL95748.1 MiaA protein [Azoarcus olearius]